MSVNSSFSNSSDSPHFIKCHFSTTGTFIFVGYTVTSVLFLLPVYILVLYMGVQRWRGQRSVHGGKSATHTDLFTYHMVVMEIIGLSGFVSYSFGICTGNGQLTVLGGYLFSFIFPGQSVFHCLTCVEHYLAVVHPITYLHLRKPGKIRIREISVGCIWLLCCGWVAMKPLNHPSVSIISFLSLLGFSIIVVLFCSLSVLYVLIRPRPGEVGRDKAGVDQSKQRAFHIIVTILGALLLRFAGYVVCFGVSKLLLVHKDFCLLLNSGIWLTLPSNLFLPLLFLHRAGRLPCCGQSNESG